MTTLSIGDVRLLLIQGDITEQDVDAIVNAANSTLMGGGGVDGAIHKKGGAAILEACKKIREESYPDGLPAGEAVITTAGRLPAAYVVHTVGPRWQGGDRDESMLLSIAYRNSLLQARHESLRTIAFPSISTGVYGYPIQQAARIAIQTVAAFVKSHPDAFDEVRFILFSGEDFEVYEKTLATFAEQLG